MGTYDMSKDKPENTLDLLVWRARCIEKYAQTEQALNMLFAYLIGSSAEIAGIIFFRITSSHSRNIIIQDLLSSCLGETYQHYWRGIPNTPNKRGLINLIKDLDQRRNEIVHWHTATNVAFENDKPKAHVSLIKPNIWAMKSDSHQVTVEDMIQFVAKADFVDRSISSFSIRVFHPKAAEMADADTWHEIFQQPCTYPPPDNHPLTQKNEAPENPPRS